ncbi:glycosyl hydrolase family 28-related protein [Cohnella soli]|uniref:Glycosyl hydrolase family 28-related protein n=1 Tax=Cohnella soli TaxID=425005 RepID=A0ABW0I3P7_9BACL
MSDQQQSKDSSTKPVSRKKFLVSMGMTGAALAAGSLLSPTSLLPRAKAASGAGNVEVVTSISALKALSKTTYFFAFVTGYYASGDGGGGNYYFDSTDTTSADNGGTVIVASDGGRWKLAATDKISLRQFGAKGNGISDDTAATQAAMTWCADNNHALYVPSGTYIITSPVTTSVAITVVGEAQSPSATPSYPQGVPAVTFLSTVAADYCFKFGNSYQRGGQLRNFRIYGAGINGSGMLLKNQGWDGLIDSVVVEGFQQYGVTGDYIQDMHIRALGIIDCGTENVYPSLNLVNNCNSVHFDRLHIEITPYMLNISGGSDITFNGCHFEVSEYPSGGITVVNRYSRYSQIVINNGSNHIDFNACLFAPNSVQAVASHFGVAETSVAPFMIITSYKVNIRGCQFRQTQTGKSSNMVSFTSSSSCIVDGCAFDQVYMDQYAILLSGTTFINNDVTWIDNGTSTKFYGIANSSNGSPSRVKDNRFFCFNGSVSAKTSGYIVYTNAAIAPITLGDNEYYVSKFYKHHNTACKADAFVVRDQRVLNGVSTLDLERYDINTLFGYTATTTTSSIINPAAGQQVSFINYAVSTSTIQNGGIVVLKGSTNATLPTNGLLVLQETLNGILVEKSRNF